MPEGFPRIVVLDFEATCNLGDPPDPQEVIEFPSVLVDLESGAVVDAFESFVRPVHHPKLSDFCTELTSITQADVDGADPFEVVFARHQAWLRSHDLVDPETFAILTCGNWDFRTLFPRQCEAAGVLLADVPRCYRRWIDLKVPFAKTMKAKKAGGMVKMLAALDLELQGRHHRGIDDCRNIARVVLELASRGATFEITAEIPRSRYPDLPLVLRHGDIEKHVVLRKRAYPSLEGLVSGAYRRQCVALHHDGAPLDDDTVVDLRPGDVLDVTLRAD